MRYPDAPEGVTFTTSPQPRERRGLVVRCLYCGRPFSLRSVAVTFWALREELGFIGACCLPACHRIRLNEKIQEVEQAEQANT